MRKHSASHKARLPNGLRRSKPSFTLYKDTAFVIKNIWILSNKIAAVATIIVKAKEPRLLYHNKPKGR